MIHRSIPIHRKQIFDIHQKSKTFRNNKPFRTIAAAGAASLVMVMVMADDELKPARKEKKNNKRKKIKKDKWGQPLLPEPEDGEEEEQLAPVEAEAAETGPGSGDGGGEEAYEAHKVVASGMPYSTTEEEIRELFEECGPIRQLQLSRFPDSGNFRGLAFITFEVSMFSLSPVWFRGFDKEVLALSIREVWCMSTV